MNLLQSNLTRIILVVVGISAAVLAVTLPGARADTAAPAWVPPALTGHFDSSTGMFNYKAANTVRTRASLTGAATAQQNHLFVGDSISAGWNALTPTFQGKIDRDKSYPYYYRRALNTKLNLPAETGTGLVRTFELNGYSTPYFDARWSPGPNGVGVQAKGHYVNVTNSSVTFNSAAKNFTSVAGTAVGVTYIDASDFKVSIDGGAAVTVKGTKTGKVMRYNKTGLTNKAHTVKVAVAFGANAKIVGAEVYSPKGISAHNVAQGGSGVTGGKQDDWSVAGDPSLVMSSTFNNASAYSSKPSTVFIELGGNDLNTNAANLAAVRDGIKETADLYPGSDIVILGLAHGSSQFSKVDIKPLLTMLYQMAYDNNWAYWDLEYVTGGYDGLAAMGYVGDNYGHITPAGYKWLGEKLANIVANAPRQ